MDNENNQIQSVKEILKLAQNFRKVFQRGHNSVTVTDKTDIKSYASQIEEKAKSLLNVLSGNS